MKVIQVALPKNEKNLSQFRDILHSELRSLTNKLVKYHIDEREDSERIFFHCQFWPMHEHTVDTFDIIRQAMSFALAEFIVQHKEKDILREILVQEFALDDEKQIDDISKYTFFLLNLDELGEEAETARKSQLKQGIAAKAMDFFLLENQLAVEGFIRFRLKEQWEGWRSAIEHALDEYWVEKENKEFICLLRHFLNNKESVHPLVHLIHIDDRNLLLYNQGWTMIHPTVNEKSPEAKASYEDAILHSLISLAPEKLVVHTEQPNHHIIYTIRQIFEPNIQVCRTCKKCKGLLKSDGASSFTN
ncbi:sporulation protein YtxC [Ammoniphilus sp. 3BR4]|uniref:sporulation protein YtxC n=1 Tax=Ammoniphilus sp. 3BR4 TaxID=3158265 RepID=UPI003466E20F